MKHFLNFEPGLPVNGKTVTIRPSQEQPRQAPRSKVTLNIFFNR